MILQALRLMPRVSGRTQPQWRCEVLLSSLSDSAVITCSYKFSVKILVSAWSVWVPVVIVKTRGGVSHLLLCTQRVVSANKCFFTMKGLWWKVCCCCCCFFFKQTDNRKGTKRQIFPGAKKPAATDGWNSSNSLKSLRKGGEVSCCNVKCMIIPYH